MSSTSDRHLLYDQPVDTETNETQRDAGNSVFSKPHAESGAAFQDVGSLLFELSLTGEVAVNTQSNEGAGTCDPGGGISVFQENKN